MSRTLNPQNGVAIEVLDEPGQGGACHDYMLSVQDGDNWIINFQNGPVDEAGYNGITIEALLVVCIDRLEYFQNGPFACAENQQALLSLTAALEALNARTADRQNRGVEGKNEA